ILFFFGLNESFKGEDGLKDFESQLNQLVTDTKAKKYNGSTPPRIVLVSPIAFEKTHNDHLPDGTEENANLELYTNAIARVASSNDVEFADVFRPTLKLFGSSDEDLTLNGIHLNEAGYRAFATILDRQLFGSGGPESIDETLRAEIADKNFHWWHRYRAVNGYSIYGSRGQAGFDGTYRNRDVMERERDILAQMADNRDQRIWKVASGQDVPNSIDDSNTLPFINPKTNVGGDDDPNQKKGKLGSLNYLTAEEQRKKFRLADGYEIQLVASEEQFPELANPVALQFDNKGRLWVATMQSYPHWKPKTPMDDKLLILEDVDGDGRADECKTFAGGLHQPTGFEIGNGGVYVAMQPDILFLQDLDGDDSADTRVRQLVGFDSADSHHGISAFEFGPGGNLYFEEGTFKYSAVESPYGVTRLGEGGVWFYHPKSQRFGAHINFAFANPWGHVFDRWGQNFIGDASPGNSYFAAAISGRIDFPRKHPGGSQHRRVAKLIGDDPSIVFPTFYPKRTRPLAGCAMVSSRHFPDDTQGNFLVTNCIGDRGVLSHQVREEGSGFVGKEVEPIVMCDDGNFRPVDLQFAPDGSLYLVDWHNALIGHLQHNLRDPNRDKSHGRIWRITYPSRPLVEQPSIDGASLPELLDLLKVPEDRARYRTRRELAQRDSDDVLDAVKTWVAGLDEEDVEHEHQMLEALWIHQTHDVINEDLLQRMLDSTDHRARAAAVRTLSFWIDRVEKPLERIAAAVNDDHPRVRLEGVRALSFSVGPKPVATNDEAIEVALQVLEYDMDDYLQYSLDETMRVLDPLP
ncbi:MAG: PVC-type heme-binding CxxCH protein, partial [Planctomycetota bacterium]